LAEEIEPARSVFSDVLSKRDHSYNQVFASARIFHPAQWCFFCRQAVQKLSDFDACHFARMTLVVKEEYSGNFLTSFLIT
jgi:hypothetical protein